MSIDNLKTLKDLIFSRKHQLFLLFVISEYLKEYLKRKNQLKCEKFLINNIDVYQKNI